MATLTGQSIASTYALLLKIDSGGIDGTLRAIEDGDATDSALKISTTGIEVDTNLTGTVTATTIGAAIDFDATGITASGQTATNIGLDLDINSNAPTMVGTVNNTGIDLDLTAGTSGVQTNVGMNIAVTGADTNYALITSGGNVGIGTTSPTAMFHVEDATITDTDGFTGIYLNFTKTAGASDNNAIYRATRNTLIFNDADAYFLDLYGIHNTVVAQAAEASESRDIFSIHNTVQMLGDTDVSNVYGMSSTVDVDAGKVDVNIYGSKIDVDVHGDATVDGTIYGLYVSMTDADDTSSSRILLNTLGNTNVDNHLQCYDGVGSTVAVKISRAGQIDAEGSINASQSLDYAEYFESKDGKTIAIGKTVKLDGDKIVVCGEGDVPLGVVRPTGSSSIVGGGQSFHWKEKYMKDDYGAVVWEGYTLTKWSEEITFEEHVKRGKDETGGSMGGKLTESRVEGSKEVLYMEGEELPEGKEVGDVKIAKVADTFFREHSYHSDRIPEGITAPNNAETITPGNKRQKLNPDFNDSKEYNPREDRDEWHIVGLLGQIPITKGQPTGSWIKMNDVSDTVEMYFVK